MGASSGPGSNNRNQPPPNMLPPRHSNGLNPDGVRESPAAVKKEDNFTDAYKVSLHDIARERVDVISEKMRLLPDDYLEELKTILRATLEGNGGSRYREDLFLLQKLVQTRSDLTATSLTRAHRVQLEILVAINSGIQAFLHPNVSLSQSALIEVFVYKRCRNIACQNLLPAEECKCETCSNRKGFCNRCMCTICSKFDFEVNTCRWIGCDFCAHWTHTDCAIRQGQIRTGNGMVFGCRACNQTSGLLGWVKDVFRHCAPSWSRESLVRELDFVSRIFRGSEDAKGRRLFWRCEELVEKLKGGGAAAEAAACRVMLTLFEELGLDSPKQTDSGGSGATISPKDACSMISEVVQEAVRKMDTVAAEKTQILKRARFDIETCDRELEDKEREVEELKLERQHKKQQREELESIVRLKQAEGDMFQAKADEARREADRLQSIVVAKSKKSEDEYAAKYLKLRLSEAETERQFLFEKMKLEESPADPSHAIIYSRIQHLLKNVCADQHATSTGKNP